MGLLVRSRDAFMAAGAAFFRPQAGSDRIGNEAEGLWTDSNNWWHEVGWPPPAAGVPVSIRRAMSDSAMYACVNLLGRVTGTVGFDLVRRTGLTTTELASDHPLYRMFAWSPNDEQTSYDFRRDQIIHLCTSGNAYTEKHSTRRGDPGELTAVDPAHVIVDWVRLRKSSRSPNRTRARVYDVSSEHDGKARVLRRDRMSHVQLQSVNGGLTGAAPVYLHQEGISLSLAAQIHAARKFGPDSISAGLVLESEHDPPQDEDERERIEGEVKGKHGGAYKHWKALFAWDGLKAKWAPTNQSQQFDEIRRFEIAEKSRIYGIPLQLLNEHAGQTQWGTGLEQNVRSFVMFTLQPLGALFARRLAFDCLDDPLLMLRFNWQELMEGDMKTLWEMMAKGIRASLINPNEGRARLGMNPRADGNGDVYRVESNLEPDDEDFGTRSKKASESQENLNGTGGDGENGQAAAIAAAEAETTTEGGLAT